jgi:uncharacterized protein DUF4349/putative zinc finger protein
MTVENHPINQEQVMAYLDGELAPDEAARVAQHLDQCAVCTELATSLRRVFARLGDWEVEPPPAQLIEKILEVIKKSEMKERPNGRKLKRVGGFAVKRFFRRPWAWAPIGITAFALSLLLIFRSGSAPRGELAVSKQMSAPATVPLDLMQGPGDKSTSVPPGPPPPPPTPEAAVTGPMIARTASLSISVKDLSAARSSMEKIVNALQGYVSSLNLSTEKSFPRSLKAVLAVPSAQYDGALAQLRALGHVAQEQQSSEEVSAQAVDLNARLKNASDTESRLAEILRERTGKIGDVLEVEREMARVRGEIEGMEAEQKHLNRRVAFASIDLDLMEEYNAPLGDEAFGAGRQMRNAFVDGYHSAAAGLLAVCVFLLSVGPSLILWTLLLLWPAIWAWRRWRPRASSQSSQTL